jgi:hypothetical protein
MGLLERVGPVKLGWPTSCRCIGKTASYVAAIARARVFHLHGQEIRALSLELSDDVLWYRQEICHSTSWFFPERRENSRLILYQGSRSNPAAYIAETRATSRLDLLAG